MSQKRIPGRPVEINVSRSFITNSTFSVQVKGSSPKVSTTECYYDSDYTVLDILFLVLVVWLLVCVLCMYATGMRCVGLTKHT